MIVCLDTNIVIYLIEANPVWTPKVTARISALLTSGEELAVCDAARLECLVKPIATGNSADQASYRAFFSSKTVRMLPVSSATWEHAAQLGATFQRKALDCVHLAAAIEHGCGLFLTADVQLKKCTAIPHLGHVGLRCFMAMASVHTSLRGIIWRTVARLPSRKGRGRRASRTDCA